jgi:hypothetical protein
LERERPSRVDGDGIGAGHDDRRVDWSVAEDEDKVPAQAVARRGLAQGCSKLNGSWKANREMRVSRLISGGVSKISPDQFEASIAGSGFYKLVSDHPLVSIREEKTLVIGGERCICWYML